MKTLTEFCLVHFFGDAIARAESVESEWTPPRYGPFSLRKLAEIALVVVELIFLEKLLGRLIVNIFNVVNDAEYLLVLLLQLDIYITAINGFVRGSPLLLAPLLLVLAADIVIFSVDLATRLHETLSTYHMDMGDLSHIEEGPHKTRLIQQFQEYHDERLWMEISLDVNDAILVAFLTLQLAALAYYTYLLYQRVSLRSSEPMLEASTPSADGADFVVAVAKNNANGSTTSIEL